MLIRKGRVCTRSHRPRPQRPNAQCPKPGQIIVDALLGTGWTPFSATSVRPCCLCSTGSTTPIRFIVPVHEQGGCHMADAYARASGKTGVIIATSGPGACTSLPA